MTHFKKEIFFFVSGTRVMDLVVVCRLHAVLRRLLCRRSGLDSLDDHGRAFLARPKAGGHVGRRPH